MNLLLQSLSIENFKGIRQLKLSPNGRSLRIKGKNGMCKTAIFDGFLWLLFGKNSDGKTGFGVKPTFATDGVEPSVTGVFTMDGKLLELGKVLAAKFVKDTGEFKESKTECYINGVKKAPREFEAFIAENLCTEAQFRLLTNPHHFNNSIDWKERRKILFDVCKIGDERNIISQNCAFSPLSEQLERYGSIDEYRTFLRDKKKKISEQINGLPIRIDEAYKQFDGTLDKAKIMADLTTARGHLGALQTELSQAKNTAAIAEIDLLKAEIKKMESANFSYRNEQSLKQTTEKFSAKTTAMTAITNLEREISQTSFELATITGNKNSLISEREKALVDYADLQASNWSGDDVCPTCKRALPEEEIEASKGNFNEAKAKALTEFSAKSDRLSAEIPELTAKGDGLHYQLTRDKKRLEMAQAIAAEVEKKEIVVCDLEGFAEKKALVLGQISALEKLLASSQGEAEERLKQAILLATEDVARSEKLLAKTEQNAEITARIDELRAKQKVLAAEQGELLKALDLSDEFIRVKVRMVESSVNEKFKIARFKLFTENASDGKLSECCEALANNSPDYSDVNKSGKVLLGFDILRTLSAFYGFSAPLFIDDFDGLDSENQQKVMAESGFAQLITLTVSDDKNLIVEG